MISTTATTGMLNVTGQKAISPPPGRSHHQQVGLMAHRGREGASVAEHHGNRERLDRRAEPLRRQDRTAPGHAQTACGLWVLESADCSWTTSTGSQRRCAYGVPSRDVRASIRCRGAGHLSVLSSRLAPWPTAAGAIWFRATGPRNDGDSVRCLPMPRGKAPLPGRGEDFRGLKGRNIAEPGGSNVGANPVTIFLRIVVDDVEGVPEIE